MASISVLVVVFMLDFAAFSLVVAAEQHGSSAHIPVIAQANYCVYDADMTTCLSVGSFLFLLAGQVLIMAFTRCLCCGRSLHPCCSRKWAIALFITCWATFFTAEACLLFGSVRKAYHIKYRTSLFEHPHSCETLRKGILIAAKVFIVITCIASELFYVSYTKADNGLLPLSRDTTHQHKDGIPLADRTFLS